MGKNESAPSSFFICLIRPESRSTTLFVSSAFGLTEYDLAAVQYTDKLVPRRLVMVDLQ